MYVSVSKAFDQLKSLGPAATDVEMRSLGPEGGGSDEMLGHMIQLLLDQLKTGKDFELIQAHMSLFLKVHTLRLSLCFSINSLSIISATI